MSTTPLLLLFLFHFFIPSLSDPRTTEAAQNCTIPRNTSISQRQILIANTLDAFNSMNPSIALQRYAFSVIGTKNSSVYAFAECMKDLSGPDCTVCFAQSKTKVAMCLGTHGGRAFLDGCYIRFDDHNFFNQSLSDQDRTVCGNRDYGGNQSVFEANSMELVRNLSVEAPRKYGFYVGFVRRSNVSVYGLAQCWKFVNGSACETCLADAVHRIASCTPKQEGRVLNAGCYLRYSIQKFYANSSNSNDALIIGNQGNQQSAIVLVAESSTVLALLLIIATVIFFVRKTVMKKKRERKQFGALLDTVNNSKLNSAYEVLEKATNYFCASNKLGQGGSGSVYKGVMPDGKIVAIKRLSFHTTQWADHFFNEVNLISGIHHKNLVQLLGCSITGPESLLVYEYVPNGSLHDHFSVKQKSKPLTWEARHKIILGTAEGLAYLHEESHVRIIHRDIKLSNIMLDLDFTPKIADFGLARLFPQDKTHLSTTIAGTLGYIAPEYVIRGNLTEKADVYSFGIVLIEIVSGKMTRSFVLNSSSILQVVWDLHRSGKLCDIVDPNLEGNFLEEEACRLLEIGLLCTQASSQRRPSMSEVVGMMRNINEEIPEPTQPPFLVSNSAECSKSRYSVQDGSYTHNSSGDSCMTESLLHSI